MLHDKLLKPYNPQETEGRIYKLWEESGFFNPDHLPSSSIKPQAPSFSMVMPPPNVTGVLHMGHALMLTLQDIMIRYKRMRGFKTLWLPGTDHAAIATQSVVEKELYKKEGKTRHEIGREEFLRRINAFVEQNRATITSQIRVMGASCDWSRETFTLDETRSAAVRAVFKKMYDDGLIYRGHRIVNWDPKGQTTISDDEIVYEEQKTKLYTFRYAKDFPIPVATTRPETKLGDVAVAVHPDDVRYKEYIGQSFAIADFVGVPLTIQIVGDSAIDPAFGTGAVGVTPAHSATDWEIAERHNLNKELVLINEYARMTEQAGQYAGKKVAEAREAVVEWLKMRGLLEKEEEMTHNVATAERTGGIVEPLPKLQWFVDVNKPIAARGGKTLKELMRAHVANGEIKIIPEHFTKTYFHWIENLRDWCISRQIWYGHRIPVWYCPTCKHERVSPEIHGRWYFIRHGETDWNKESKMQGRTDIPLNETGKQQARATGEFLKKADIDLIISSHLKRAHETAKIIGAIIGAEVIADERLQERDFGKAEGSVFADAVEKFNDIVTHAGKSADNENFEELEERLMQAVGEHAKKHSHRNVLFVSHGGTQRALLRRVRNTDKRAFDTRRWVIKNTEIAYFDVSDPCEKCANFLFEEDSDTLDTWFSSGLWTFSTLGWPHYAQSATRGKPGPENDLANFHPTDVLETGYEILFFWVARMILMSGYALGTVPFRTVYLHGTVRDAKGRKMSKSLGNGIDPIDVAKKFGTDAGRMALIVGNTPGTDTNISEDKIRGYKNFANKIWNIARFILENTAGASVEIGFSAYAPTDANLREERHTLLVDVTNDMEQYRFYMAAEKLYHYVWHTFADKVLEESKEILKSGTPEEQKSRRQFLLHTLDKLLKALHPFIPFVTEEIWLLWRMQQPTINNQQPMKDGMLMVQEWPVGN